MYVYLYIFLAIVKILYIFFSIWVLFHEHSRITGLQGKGEGIPLTPHYHFHPLHRHLDISRAIWQITYDKCKDENIALAVDFKPRISYIKAI